jgi:glycosyltransferase involved in cell wall biosynthesis
MAVYNGLPYLGQAVDSLLAQTMGDFELIIVNDCSTDGSRAVLEAYTDPRLKLVNLEKNGGQTAALNHGLSLARAPFIARQDADDLSKPDRLAKQLAFFNQHPDYVLLGTAADLIDSRGRVTGQMIHQTIDEDIREQFHTENCMFHGSVMFRREVLEQVGGYREGFRNAQDYDYWLRISEAGRVANLAEPLYQYRMHEGQMTFTSYYRMKDEAKLIIRLGQVRQAGGDDSAAYAEGLAALKAKYEHFQPTPAQKRRALSELWRGQGVSYMKSRRYGRMAYCLARAFLYEPLNPDFWRGVRNQLPR